MSLQTKFNRKSLAFLTPQSRKTHSSARLSLSSNAQTAEHVLGNLLNDPLKRALLVEVLSQDVKTPNKTGKKEKRVQKFKFESPTALCRRRGLAKMQGNSDSSDTSSIKYKNFTKVPFNQILKGVTAYVEIMSQGKDRSSGVKSLMLAMGADVRDVFSRDLTHVVFKDGSFRTYQKAKLLKIHLVSVLWVDAARRHKCRMPEKDHPAFGTNVSNANASLICRQFQKEYEDVLQEELNRSKITILPDTHSEDIINNSQNCNSPSLMLESNARNDIVVTPNSMYLHSTPDITSDSDSENCFTSNKNLFLKHRDNNAENHIISKENDVDKKTKEEQIEVSQLNSRLARISSQSEEISPLIISTNSDCNANSPHPVLNDKNVTQRKKRTDTKNKINILQQHIIKSSSFSINEVNCEKDLEENNFAQQELKNFNGSPCVDIKNRKSLKNSKRKLYNVGDNEQEYIENNKLKDVSKNKIEGCEPTANNIKCSDIEKDNRNKGRLQSPNDKSCFTTPKNLKKKQSSKTTPRRQSSRLCQYQNNVSPQKRFRRNSIDGNILKPNINVTDSNENDVPLDVIKPKENLTSNAGCTKTTSSRKTLNFGQSSNKKSPSNKTEVFKPSLPKNSAISSPENKKDDSSDAQTKYNNLSKPTRKSMRILSFINSTSNLRSSIIPDNNQAMNNTDNSDNDSINHQILTSKKNQKLEENNIGSSDEFISKSITNKDKITNNDEGNVYIPSDENTVKKNKSQHISNFLERNKIDEVQDNIESSPATIRRSSLDFMSKESIYTTQNKSKANTPSGKLKYTQRTKSVKKTSIVCTRFHSTEVQVFNQIVKKLGVFFVEDEVTEKTTHLVAAEPRRTVNLLRGIARGCWILKSEWLYRSLEADQWLPEEDYELCNFSDAVQKSRQERQAFGPKFSLDIFQNCGRIYISRGTNPRCSDLQELVTLCKGTITTTIRNADIVVGEYIDEKSCVTVNWLMDSITFYKRKSLKNYIINPVIND